MKMLNTLAVEFECKIHAKCRSIGSNVVDAVSDLQACCCMMWLLFGRYMVRIHYIDINHCDRVYFYLLLLYYLKLFRFRS